MIENLTPPATPDALKQARDDFPVLSRTVNGKRLIYLDNAAFNSKTAVGYRRSQSLLLA